MNKTIFDEVYEEVPEDQEGYNRYIIKDAIAAHLRLRYAIFNKACLNCDTINNGTEHYQIIFKEDIEKPLYDWLLSKGMGDKNILQIPTKDVRIYGPVDDELFYISCDKEFIMNFFRSIQNAKQLNQIEVDDYEQNCLLKNQVFVSVITAIETLLSDTLIGLTQEYPKYLRSWVESYDPYKKQNIAYTQVFSTHENIAEIAKKDMQSIVYHNLPVVSGNVS